MAATSDYASAFPEKLRAGSTLKVEVGYSDFPAPDWVATLILVRTNNKQTVVATANGSDHRFLASAATTAGWETGQFTWVVEVTGTVDSVSETHVAAQGTMEVLVDFAAGGNYDARTTAKKTLEAIEAVIENRGSQDQLSYSIAGRSLSKMPITDLLMFRDRYKAMVNLEERQERRNRGLSSSDQIITRF